MLVKLEAVHDYLHCKTGEQYIRLDIREIPRLHLAFESACSRWRPNWDERSVGNIKVCVRFMRDLMGNRLIDT